MLILTVIQYSPSVKSENMVDAWTFYECFISISDSAGWNLNYFYPVRVNVYGVFPL